MENKHPIEDIDIYGEQVREVLNKPPGWLLLTGSTLVFTFVIMILGLSGIIKYPDVLAGRIVITSQSPPVSVISNSNGRIEKLIAQDNDTILQGQAMAIIENLAQYTDIVTLQSIIQKIEPDCKDINRSLDFPNNLQLGALQNFYSTFVKDYETLKMHNHLKPEEHQVLAYNKQINQYKQYVKRQEQQQKSLESEINITQTDMDRARKLYSQGVISKKDLEDKSRELMRIKRGVEDIMLAKSSTQITIGNIEKSVSDIEIQGSQSDEQLRIQAFASLQNLINRLSEWQQTYILAAPISGKVTYFSFWSENQNVKQGDELFSIIPNDNASIIGKVLLPLQNTGKLKVGQKAIIKLDNYNFSEFGTITGIVAKISNIPKQNNYAVEINLPQPLVTNTGHVISLEKEIQGNVDIVTEDMKLIERIFYQIRKVFL